MKYKKFKKKKQRSELKNNFILDGTTGKRIKKERRKETIAEKNLREYLELQEKVKKHNPLPKREDNLPRLKVSEDPNSNFINVRGGYFNKGSKKGCDVSSVNIKYLIWVTNNIELNTSELKYIRRVIKKKNRNNLLK